MTHGHELKGGNVGGSGCAGRREIEGGNGTTNSIINKIYYFFKKKITRSCEALIASPWFCSNLEYHWLLVQKRAPKNKKKTNPIKETCNQHFSHWGCVESKWTMIRVSDSKSLGYQHLRQESEKPKMKYSSRETIWKVSQKGKPCPN